MKIKRETDYAIRCILYLAGQPEKVTLIDEIAEQMSVPRDFLAKIVQRLAKQGIVKSFRGINGGLRLNRAASEVNLLEVIEAVEGPVSMNDCALEERSCDRATICPVHPVWLEIREEVRHILQSKTFERLEKKE